MSFVYGPLTDCLGQTLTTAPDGSGGIVLTCPKYGSLTVTATQLQDVVTERLVQRVCSAEDFYTSWRNLTMYLGNPDPGT